jgi:hypothetical protein
VQHIDGASSAESWEEGSTTQATRAARFITDATNSDEQCMLDEMLPEHSDDTDAASILEMTDQAAQPSATLITAATMEHSLPIEVIVPDYQRYISETVAVSNFDTIPSGYTATHRRIYRSVSGTYLFVAEVTAATTSYTDSVSAEDLGEEIPSLTWLPPPATLKGLTNLPNGIMAGFVGRDIYFCDPYHPHAWPIAYNQTVDYPVVGLGRMDTTLAVLTTGTPYFLQRRAITAGGLPYAV